MVRIPNSLFVALLLIGTFASAAENPPAKITPEPYAGFKADQALLRKQVIYKAKDGTETKAPSGEACEAAQRIFSRVSFLFRTRGEVIDLLGDPATVSDYNRPPGEELGSPLIYNFDSGFGGYKYTIRFDPLDKTRVNGVEVEGQD